LKKLENGKELEELREIALSCGLAETLKWGVACYTLEKGNVVIIHAFKEYCAFLFFKGALMKDPNNILIQQTENVQSARQIRFTNLQEITKLKTILKTYIAQAIEIEKSGAKVDFKKTREFPKPEEFETKLQENPALKPAFEALTPGRQRAYLLYFAAAKQTKTREARIEKYTDRILDGIGLDDDYSG
jgi:uncharacterized protein YdeI (YjbR/CyaY-like superfamily)